MGQTESQQTPEDSEADHFFAQVDDKSQTATANSDFFALPAAYKTYLAERVKKQFGDSLAFAASRPQSYPSVPGKFQDTDFPPGKLSLIQYWNQADIVSQVEWERYSWARLSDLFPNMVIFDDIQPNDIQQGSLGDCYFLSALSALAENQERIKRLFITKETPSDCCYKISLLNLGQWMEYRIDDYFPIRQSESQSSRPAIVGTKRPMETPLAFSGPRIEKGKVELWVLLLEKAWAKKYGSFYDIQAGFTDEVLTDLTGAPCETISTKDSRLWTKILDADKRNYILTAGCVGSSISSDDAELYRSLGLVVDHAYALISAKEITVGKDKVSLLKIRNPWGNFEWKGAWSDYSEKWTPETKAQVDYQAIDDGSFWICFEDFQKYFESCTICMVNDDFWTMGLAMDQTKDEEFSVVEIVVSKATRMYFMVCQIDERRFGGAEAGYQYSPVRLIAARLNPDNSLKYIDGKMSAYSRDSWIEVELTPGTYLFYAELNWRSDITDLFGVSVYSQEQVGLRDVTSLYPDYLQQCFNPSFYQTFPVTAKFLASQFSYYSCKLVGKKENGDMREGLYVDVFVNKTENQKIVVTVKHEPWVNTQLLRPYNTHIKGNFELELMPGETKVVLKKQANLLSKHGFKVLLKKRFLPLT